MFGSEIDLANILLMYVCLLFSLCVHEASHALVADLCGDSTARFMGRVTLNPIPHIDPIGTVLLPLIMMVFQVPLMFGWAKPVPFNPRNLRNIRRDPVLIAIAGPGANFLMACLFALVLRIIVQFSGLNSGDELMMNPACKVAFSMILVNLGLMIFNCIPVPPLDGSHVLYYLLPLSGKRALMQIGPYGILIVLFISQYTHILNKPFGFLLQLIISLAFWGM